MSVDEASLAETVGYHEPARRYTSSLALLLVLAAGYLLDLALGGGLTHLIGWLIAAVIVVGIDALRVRAARSLRSITVTVDEVRVGEHALARSEIDSVEPAVDPSTPILGRGGGAALPRGARGLAVRLTGGGSIVIPTRRPDRLAQVLLLSVASPEIRPAEPGELAGLPEIDARAESLFHVSGIRLPRIPIAVDELHEAKAIFVAGRPPVGFVRVDEVDGLAHVEELAVVPGSMRHGLGTALLSAACSWAAANGYPAITLITYADVAWNAPFYAARGFAEMAELTPEIAELRDWERDVGLDALGRRVVMRRELGRVLSAGPSGSHRRGGSPRR